MFEISQQNRQSYTAAADKINASDIQLLVIEHEYGIFGGESGEYLLDLVNNVKKPIITTLHTVLPHPDKTQQKILERLCTKSEKIIIMAENSRELLQNVYNADTHKIEKVHHGVPYFNFPSREVLKKQCHLEGRTIVSTFGLLNPSKGIDYGIKAIKQTAAKHPDILYLILGQTHPVVRKLNGESYRQSLEKMVSDYKLQNNVSFVNKYLTKQEIVRWLKLSDIYMTPYLGQEQAVSGTLAYAAGCGRAIVSTPYPYAKEMLADGRGILAKFKDSASLSDCINYIIEHPEQKKIMEEKTLQVGKNLRWYAVAEHYAQIFYKVCTYFKIHTISTGHTFSYDKYIFRMTDDTGIFQHAVYAVPDPSEGYTSDDNARALIMAGLLFKTTRGPKYLELAVIYLRFMLYAYNDGWFRNFMNYDHHFIEEKGSEDCFGRCVWALGFTASLTCLPNNVRMAADKMLRGTLSQYSSLTFLRAKAYSLIGLSFWNQPAAADIINKLAADINTAYKNHAENSWQWFDNELTYCNAVLPHAMLCAYDIAKIDDFKTTGLNSLKFLLNKTFYEDIFHPIGCKGWQQKDNSAAVFDEQPVEACATLLACLKAYNLTNEAYYLQCAKNCFEWYLGKNISNLSLIDSDTGGCMDGITKTGLNKNEGSESLISWVISISTMNELKNHHNIA